MVRLLLVLFLTITPEILSQSGWIITERTTGMTGADSYETTLYIQDNRIRSEENSYSVILDLNIWQITILDPSREGYWQGSPGEYLDYMKEYALSYIKEEIALADDNDRPYLEALYEDLKMEVNTGTDAISFLGELPVEIIMNGENSRILGHPVRRFDVFADGARVEEIWLARDIKFEDSYDYKKFRSFTDAMSWGQIFQDHRSSEQYIHLMKQGIPMKTIETGENGTLNVTEVISIQKTEIPPSIFTVPRNYRKMDFPGMDSGLF
jgi:hypothetical protein